MIQGRSQELGVAIPKAIQNTIRLEDEIIERCSWYQIPSLYFTARRAPPYSLSPSTANPHIRNSTFTS
jgi:hypothetical protein